MELRLAVVFHRLIILQINKIRHCNDAEDKMEAYYIGFHFAGMAGDQHLIRAKHLARVTFGLGRGESHNMLTHVVRHFDPHVPFPVEANHSYLLSVCLVRAAVDKPAVCDAGFHRATSPDYFPTGLCLSMD
jgi:hypothetical protein